MVHHVRNAGRNLISELLNSPSSVLTEEDAVHVFVHLLKPNLFVAEHLADKNPSLVPADVSAVVYSPSLERRLKHPLFKQRRAVSGRLLIFAARSTERLHVAFLQASGTSPLWLLPSVCW